VHILRSEAFGRGGLTPGTSYNELQGAY
jgi:hypothetical protein